MHHSSHGGKPKMDPKVTLIKREQFNKNPDGSWVCVKNSDIQNSYGIYRVNRGMVFKEGISQWGIDVVGLLDQADA